MDARRVGSGDGEWGRSVHGPPTNMPGQGTVMNIDTNCKSGHWLVDVAKVVVAPKEVKELMKAETRKTDAQTRLIHANAACREEMARHLRLRNDEQEALDCAPTPLALEDKR